MDTTQPVSGSGRRRVAVLAGMLVLAMVAGAGCAGDGSDGQVATGGVAGTTTTAATETTGQEGSTTATTKKATSRTTTESGSSTSSDSGGGVTRSTGRRTGTTRPGSGTSASRPSTKTTKSTKPPVTKVRLTLTIDNTGNVDGAVVVSPGGTCSSTCTFTYTKGTSVSLAATDSTIEAHLSWTISGGSTTCGQGSCELGALNRDTAVTATFGSKAEGDG